MITVIESDFTIEKQAERVIRERQLTDRYRFAPETVARRVSGWQRWTGDHWQPESSRSIRPDICEEVRQMVAGQYQRGDFGKRLLTYGSYPTMNAVAAEVMRMLVRQAA
jgi:hypothetical protein